MGLDSTKSSELRIPSIDMDSGTDASVNVDDAASEHGSLADSSYDIISHSGTIDDDLGVIDGVSTPSMPASRALTPALTSSAAEDNDNDDEEEDYQHLHLPDTVNTSHQSQDADDTPLASLRLPQPSPNAIHHTQTTDLLRLDRPFRIRYYGTGPDRDAVVGKIAQALALSCPAGDTSEAALRYSVSQLSSFGADHEAPQVELVPHSGIEIVLETKEIAPDVKKSSEMTVKAQSAHVSSLQSTDLDLVVFLHANVAGTSPVALTRVRQNSIPCLQICDSAPVKSSFDLNVTDMHACVDGKKTPVDLQQFLDLDPATLNRHIAYLIQLKHEVMMQQPSATSVAWNDLLKGMRQTISIHNTMCQVVSALLVIGLAVATVLGPLYMRMSNVPLPERPHDGLAVASSTEDFVASRLTTAPFSTRALSVQSDWFSVRGPSASVVSQSAVIDIQSGSSHTAEDPPVELVHVKGWLYYLKMPHELAKSRRLPQLKVSASREGKAVDVSLAKWNATVYSIELQPESEAGPIDIFVGFEKGLRIYTYKLNPTVSWLDIQRLSSWVDQKSFESGIAACMATTKELSRIASKEVALFRDGANGFVVSSSEWLQQSAKDARKKSETTAIQLWRGFELQTMAMSRALHTYNDDISSSFSRQASRWSKAIGKHSAVFELSRVRFARELHRAQKTLETRIGLMQRRLASLRVPSVEALKAIGVAQARVKAVAAELRNRFTMNKQPKHDKHSRGQHKLKDKRMRKKSHGRA